ncbi:MAG: hypothetical protein DELT_02619 [Desulfovibrio sp.]
MPGQQTALVTNPVAHASLMGALLKFGTGLATSAIKAVASCKILRWGIKITNVVSKAACFTGAGLAAGLIGTAVSLALDKALDIAAEKMDDVKAAADDFIDSVCPPNITGEIITGSPNVFVNTKNAAITVVSIANCKKENKPPRAADGSATVFVNKQHKHRKDDAWECGAKTVKASPDVIVGGGTERVLPVAEDLADKLKRWGDYLQTGVQIFRAAIGFVKGAGALKCVLKNARKCIGTLAVSAVSVVTSLAFPVHLLSGQKFLSGEEEEDFVLPAGFLIRWQRTYSSTLLSYDMPAGPLGPGWSLPYSYTLLVNQPGEHPNILIDDQGVEMLFPEVKPGQKQYHPMGGWELSCVDRGVYVASIGDEHYLFSTAEGEGPQALRVERVGDVNGNWLAFSYAENGLVSRLSTNSGTRLDCLPHEKHPARLGQVKMHLSDQVLVSYDYDDEGCLSSVTDRAGETVRRFRYTHLPTGRFGHLPLMDWHQMPSGLEVNYKWAEFSDHPRVVWSGTSTGKSWSMEYDVANGRTAMTDHLGRKQHWTWTQESYVVLSHTDAMGRTLSVERNEFGQVVKCTDYNGGVHLAEYDDDNNRCKEIDPLGGVTSTVWHPLFRKPTRETFPDGASWEYEYDHLGNLVAVTDPNGGRTEYALNHRGLPQVVTDAEENVYRYGWDKHGLLVHYTNCMGNVTRYSYDAFGNATVIKDALGQEERADYDALGRVTALMLPDGSRRGYVWDRAGRLRTAVDGMDQPTSWDYDLENNAVSRTDAEKQRLGYDYDQAGNLARIINENGESYSFRYDVLDRQTSQTNLDGSVTRYTLDGLGLPVLVERSAGESSTVTRLERDILGRLLRKETDEAVTAYTYDAVGRVLAAVRHDISGEFTDSVEFAYDAQGNMTEEKSVVRLTEGQDDGTLRESVIRYAYDALGNMIRTVLPDGRSLEYTLGGSGFLFQVGLAATPGGKEEVIAAFERDALQRETLRTLGGLHQHSAWDPLSRLKARSSIAFKGDNLPSALTPASIKKAYGYDKNGELTGRNDSFSGERRYRYDAVGRITGASVPAASTSLGSRSLELQDALAKLHDREAVETALFSEESFAYDAASNLLATGTDGWSDWQNIGPREVRSSDFGGKGFAYDGAGHVRHNRLTELNGFTFSYDAFGRTVEKAHAQSRRTWRYTYNSEDQLTEVAAMSRSGFKKIRFTYDVLGRRIAKTDGKSATLFTWSGMRLLSEAKGETTSTYVYEYNSYAPLARLDSWNAEYFSAEGKAVPNTPGQVYYFHCNASGMPEELTDAAGHIVWRARYATWGKLAFENVTSFAPDGFEQNLRMQGQYHDRETALHYNTFRYYDYDTGRFTTEDPIGLLGGMNLYQYAPNPLVWIDPWGWLTFDSSSPDLFPVKNGQQNTVQITMQGSRQRDFTAAYKAAGLTKAEAAGYTWHHVDDFDHKTGKTTMQLVKTDGAHRTTSHKGSVSQFEKRFKVRYDTGDSVAISQKKNWLTGRAPTTPKGDC